MPSSKKKPVSLSLPFTGFLQSLGLFAYCSLMAVLLWQGNAWFPKVPNYFGPLILLTMFTTSALICGFIVLGYPVLLVLEKKRIKDAVSLVGYTAAWSVMFVFLVFILILILF